jgi:hypothetical protein
MTRRLLAAAALAGAFVTVPARAAIIPCPPGWWERQITVPTGVLGIDVTVTYCWQIPPND